ncbi:MAG: BlaI/MecI/CopY family transcriptional regulator [Thermaerobacter sp.]|nr:BlaI/MecI/CopY family transcriptional regulator [Thermaerobacter sp.]
MPIGSGNGLREQILEWVRSHGPCSVRDVHEALTRERPISLNAVATVLGRLVDQGLMVRDGDRRSYRYTVYPSASAIKERTDRTVKALLAEAGDDALVHFVDAIDRIQPEYVQKLEKILSARRSRSDS